MQLLLSLLLLLPVYPRSPRPLLTRVALPRSQWFLSLRVLFEQKFLQRHAQRCFHADTTLDSAQCSVPLMISTMFRDIQKSDIDSRQYGLVTLANGLKVLLVSDPDTDKSAASLDVHVGHLHDPDALPGLAHFLEHMVFLGTEKYPRENEYNEYLSKHSGSSNAYTSTENTNYHFSVSHAFLEGALDRFAQFFIAPLFDDSCIDREINAVDSESKKNLQADNWRIFQLEKSLSSPNHPYSKFGTGNAKTLRSIPAEKKINVRKELLNFHSQYYSANIMRLAILGKEPLEVLHKWAIEKFSAIKNKDIPVPPMFIQGHPLTDKELQRITKLRPVKDLRVIQVTFTFPPQWMFWETQPGRLISHLIGHEGEGSLFTYLKKNGLADSLSAGPRGGLTFGFFEINIELTESGLKQYDEVLRAVFSYIKLLKDQKIQEWIFHEARQLVDINFRFKEIGTPESYVSHLATYLQQEFPPEYVLSGGVLLRRWDPKLIDDALSYLDPLKFQVTIMSQSFDPKDMLKEYWYGTEYVVEKMSEDLVKSLQSPPVYPELHLPKKNPFIPEDLSVQKSITPVVVTAPRLVLEAEGIRLWYKKDEHFWVPKSTIKFAFKSPMAYVTPRMAVLTRLYCEVLKDQLNEYLYDAEVAGLNYSLNVQSDGFMLSMNGYSDKLPVFAMKIVEKMKPFIVNAQRFDIIKEKVAREYKNWSKEAPYSHAMYYLGYAEAEKQWLPKEKLAEVAGVTSEDMERFSVGLLDNLHMEALLVGNMSRERYTELATNIRSLLGYLPLRASQLVRSRAVMLPRGSSYVYQIDGQDEDNFNSAVEYYCQIAEVIDVKLRARLSLVAQIASEPCYDQLRTKEQLGYIVFSGTVKNMAMSGFRVIIQSERDTVYVENRIEEFLRQLATILFDMNDEKYQQHVESLIVKELEKDKNLLQQSNRFWHYISTGFYDFDQVNNDVAALQSISKQDLFQFYSEHIHPLSTTRRKISVHIRSRRLAQDPRVNMLYSCLKTAGYSVVDGLTGNASVIEQFQNAINADVPLTEKTLTAILSQLKLVPNTNKEATSEGAQVSPAVLQDQLLIELCRAFTMVSTSDTDQTTMEDMIQQKPPSMPRDANASLDKPLLHVQQFLLTPGTQIIEDIVQFRASMLLSAAPRPVEDLSKYLAEPKAKM